MTQTFFDLATLQGGIERQLAEGMTATVFPGDQAMVSIVDMAPNAKGRIHAHPQEQWGVMLEGSGVRIQDGERIPVKKGHFWRSPGGVAHGFEAGPDGARVLDVFAPPREEYKTAGAGFGEADLQG